MTLLVSSLINLNMNVCMLSKSKKDAISLLKYIGTYIVTLDIKPGLHRLLLRQLDSITDIKLTNVLQNRLVVESFDKTIF